MIEADLEGVDFLVASTDGQSLAHSLAPRKMQLGSSLTGGLGAGSKPEMGRKAAEESLDEVLASWQIAIWFSLQLGWAAVQEQGLPCYCQSGERTRYFDCRCGHKAL